MDIIERYFAGKHRAKDWENVKMKHFSIAIDGPAGAGKSTIAKEAGRRLGFIYVDTGAMYRAMALYLLRLGLDPKDQQAVEEACKGAQITLTYEEGLQQVYLNGENVSGLIRTEEVGNMASATSVYMAVRRKLVQLQQELAARENVIMDGRDIGTCVLPEAPVKIYLTASVEVRARRRFNELREKGVSCEIDEIEADIIARDRQDMNREHSPLRQAEDAAHIDSSYMTIEEVIQAIINEAEKKGLKR